MKLKVMYPLVFLAAFILVVGLACGSTSSTSNDEAVETSRTNPLPVGSEIIADDMAFTVVDVIRPADNLIAEGNMFNTEPEPGKEYVFVKVKVVCKKSAEEKCSLFSSSFKMVNSAGNVVDSEMFVSGVTGLLETGEFFGGASLEGYVPFIIEKSELKLILMYDPLLGKELYLSIQ